MKPGLIPGLPASYENKWRIKLDVSPQALINSNSTCDCKGNIRMNHSIPSSCLYSLVQDLECHIKDVVKNVRQCGCDESRLVKKVQECQGN